MIIDTLLHPGNATLWKRNDSIHTTPLIEAAGTDMVLCNVYFAVPNLLANVVGLTEELGTVPS